MASLAAPFAAATGTAADAASAAEPPPVAATAVTTVVPSTVAAVAAVDAAAERVGGAWEGGRAPREGRGRGGLEGPILVNLACDFVFWLAFYVFWVYICHECK